MAAYRPRVTKEEPLPIDNSTSAAKSCVSARVQDAVVLDRISQTVEDVEKQGDEKTHENSLDSFNEIAYVCNLIPHHSFSFIQILSCNAIHPYHNSKVMHPFPYIHSIVAIQNINSLSIQLSLEFYFTYLF